MTVWIAASLALLPIFIVAVIAAGRGGVGRRLVAVEMATSLAVLLLIAFDFAFDQPSSINLAMTLALLALPGTLVLVLFPGALAVNFAIDALLAAGVLCAWIGAMAFLRLRTHFERLHVITFVNVTSGAAIIVAAVLSGGMSALTLQCIFIWGGILVVGALLSHVTARALHMREGERR